MASASGGGVWATIVTVIVVVITLGRGWFGFGQNDRASYPKRISSTFEESLLTCLSLAPLPAFAVIKSLSRCSPGTSSPCLIFIGTPYDLSFLPSLKFMIPAPCDPPTATR